MTYSAGQKTIVVGPLSPTHSSRALDLCQSHVKTLTAPYGWQLVILPTVFEDAPMGAEELHHLAEKIRIAATQPAPAPQRIRVIRSGRSARFAPAISPFMPQ